MTSTNDITSESNPVLKPNPPSNYEMKSCCYKTVSELVDNNSLMMCQKCESLIKSFEDDASFRKYIMFCRSRNRPTQETSYKQYKLVLFKRC